ncbi:MAG: hypothetical protein ACK55X_13265 [Synechococcaceae cyanobacterium]|jgi:hypothetical protein
MQQQGLTILITNNTLAAPAGTECYVVTLARYLRDTGHFPIAYSTQHGAIAEKLKSLGVLVVNNLEALTIEPDIIHGHHHLDTACALARFPRTPAIAFNHGVVPWEEASFPPIERIYRYVTVSRVPTKRVYTEGITRERTAYLPNFVDADEFLADFRTKQQRTHGSPRALVYGNYPHKGLHLIESACRKQGFVLDMAGYAFGQTVSEPSALLPSYDLVFATGKAAMEALYCGAEVILSGPHGFGSHVTSANFASLYDQNFGFATSCQPPTESSVNEALHSAHRMIHSGSRGVADELIAGMSHRQVLPSLVALYGEAIAHWQSHSPSIQHQTEEEYAAFSRYLRFLQTSRFHDQELARTNQLLRTEQELASLYNELGVLHQNPFAYAYLWVSRRIITHLSNLLDRRHWRRATDLPTRR